MNDQDVVRELELPGAQELLTSTSLAHLAYNGMDGFPRVVPVGFLWNGQDIVVCTAPTAPKVGALSARPQVAVTIDAGDTPETAKALSIRGVAEVDVVEGVAEEYLAAARRTMSAEAARIFEQQVRATYRRMARIVITPRWVRLFDFGGGRLPDFLQALVEQGAER